MTTVILLAGPAGGGKTTTAARIARNKNWVHISEDDFWVEIKKNHPMNEYRTPAEEKRVKPLAVKKILESVSKGKNVVFEFLVYETPPKPILYYQKELLKHKINAIVKVIRPKVSAILKRICARGNECDKVAGIKELKKHAKNQIRCLSSKYIKKEWVIDSSNISLDQLYKKYFLPIVKESK